MEFNPVPMDIHQVPTPSMPYPISNPAPPVGPGISMNPSIEHMAGPATGEAASYAAGWTNPMTDIPPPTPAPAPALTPLVTSAHDIRSVKTSCQFALREYLALQRKRHRFDGSTTTLDLEQQIRVQAGMVLGDLKELREEVSLLVKAGEKHRWRKWLLGGAVASFIPAVKHIFRRPQSEDSTDPAANDTEYAFSRSKSLLSRINDTVLGRNGFASMAFFVFAVLYVFQNEVSIRVAKTVLKRLKRLSTKIERGDQEVGEKDMKLLEGWRWRVLLWSQ